MVLSMQQGQSIRIPYMPAIRAVSILLSSSLSRETRRTLRIHGYGCTGISAS
jgi:hypothetical protein